MDEELQDQRLSLMQDARIFSLGKLLRSSFASSSDTLGSDVTGLMIDLSKLPYGDEPEPDRRPTKVRAAPTKPASWRARIALLFARR